MTTVSPDAALIVVPEGGVRLPSAYVPPLMMRVSPPDILLMACWRLWPGPTVRVAAWPWVRAPARLSRSPRTTGVFTGIVASFASHNCAFRSHGVLSAQSIGAFSPFKEPYE